MPYLSLGKTISSQGTIYNPFPSSGSYWISPSGYYWKVYVDDTGHLHTVGPVQVERIMSGGYGGGSVVTQGYS